MSGPVNIGQLFDLAIYETLNGGDLVKIGNDLKLVFSNENQTYLAMFGGNVEGSTPAVFTGTERVDWWGNSLFFESTPNNQFNSITERTLNKTPLTSAGRLIIENAVKQDLKYLSEVATVEVIVTLPRINTVRIEIRAFYNDGVNQLTVYEFTVLESGDFRLSDFNNDFF